MKFRDLSITLKNERHNLKTEKERTEKKLEEAKKKRRENTLISNVKYHDDKVESLEIQINFQQQRIDLLSTQIDSLI